MVQLLIIIRIRSNTRLTADALSGSVPSIHRDFKEHLSSLSLTLQSFSYVTAPQDSEVRLSIGLMRLTRLLSSMLAVIVILVSKSDLVNAMGLKLESHNVFSQSSR